MFGIWQSARTFIGSLALVIGTACVPVGNNGDSIEIRRDSDRLREADDRREFQEELIVVPQVAANARLFCMDSQNGQIESMALQFIAWCSLIDPSDNSLIDIYDSALERNWRIDASSGARIQSFQFQEQPDDDFWHVQIEVNVASAREWFELRQDLKIHLNVASSGDSIIATEAGLASTALRWALSDAFAVPANAIRSGTEAMGAFDLHVCRMITDVGYLPGKLIRSVLMENRTICYSSMGNLTVASHLVDGDQFIRFHDYEVLLDMNSGQTTVWRAYDGEDIPLTAVLSSVDNEGRRGYVCRSLERGPTPEGFDAIDPNGEFLSGYHIAGSGVCIYEYFGQKQSSEFEILHLN